MSDVVNVALVKGGKIIKWESKDSRTEDLSYGDVRDIHFYTLTTDKGAMDVTLHVDHNGYYGGALEGPTIVDEVPQVAVEVTE